jgi:hypothetical protein
MHTVWSTRIHSPLWPLTLFFHSPLFLLLPPSCTELFEIFNYALVWGRSTKYDPQRCGLTHTLEDEDVVQVVGKTVTQQKREKGYTKKVQEHWDAIKLKRKKAALRS